MTDLANNSINLGFTHQINNFMFKITRQIGGPWLRELGTFTVYGDVYLNSLMHGEMLDDKYGLRENMGTIRIVFCIIPTFHEL